MSLYSSFPLDISITSRFVSADLLVTLHSGGLFFHVQALNDGVFAVPVSYVDKGFLYFQLPIQVCFLGLPFLI